MSPTPGVVYIDDVPSIGVASGAIVPLDGSRPDLIRIEDIAHHLGRINRFTGAPYMNVSVAQHSLLVLEIFEAYHPNSFAVERLAALLHDAVEYVTGDITRPMKARIAQVAGFDVVKTIERELERAVESAVGVDDLAIWCHDPRVKHCDNVALQTERNNFLPTHRGVVWRGLPAPLHWTIEPLSPHVASRRYLAKYHELRALLP